jgi:hypothetical protein
MKGSVTPIRREGGPLTKDQRALVKRAVGIAEQAAYEVGKSLGGDPRDNDRVQLAHLGIYKAAQSYEGELGPWEVWAKFKAICEILTGERKERKQRRLRAAGRIVGYRVLAANRYRAGDVPSDATDEELFGALVGLAEDQIAGEWLGALAANEELPDDDDDVAERDAWNEVMPELVGVLDSLQPGDRELLLLFAHGHDVKSIAKKRGVDYSTLLDHFHSVLALACARLVGRNVKGVPSRPLDAPAALPEREAPPPRARSPKGQEPTP